MIDSGTTLVAALPGGLFCISRSVTLSVRALQTPPCAFFRPSPSPEEDRPACWQVPARQ